MLWVSLCMIKNIDLIRGTASLNSLNKVDAFVAKKKKKVRIKCGDVKLQNMSVGQDGGR